MKITEIALEDFSITEFNFIFLVYRDGFGI